MNVSPEKLTLGLPFPSLTQTSFIEKLYPIYQTPQNHVTFAHKEIPLQDSCEATYTLVSSAWDVLVCLHRRAVLFVYYCML